MNVEKENRSFGWAIEQLKAGNKVARTGWNGNGMWLGYVESRRFDFFDAHVKTEHVTGECGLLPWICMKTADNKLVPWIASQTDMLSEDWMLIE